MSTVVFPTEEDFISWHDGKCTELRIPYPATNVETGELDTSAQWMTSYITPVIVDGNLTVTLPDEEVANDPVLSTLQVIEIKYPVPPRGTTDADGNPASDITPVPPDRYAKPIPST